MKHGSLFKRREMIQGAWLWLALLLWPCGLYAQEAPPADPTAVSDQAPAGPSRITEPFFRLGFYEWITQRFKGTHPFYLMTGNKYFKNGRTSLNSTQDNTGILISGENSHDGGQPVWVKIAHGLPPLSLDYIIPLDNSFIPAIGLGAYYTNTWLTDQTAAVGAKRQSFVPLIEMRSHYYMFSATMNLLTPPRKDGIELFYGLGQAHIETTIRNGFRGHGSLLDDNIKRQDLDHFHSPHPIFFQRLGFTSSGENFGLTIELYFMGSTPVIDNPFYKSEIIPTTPQARRINLQGVMMRLAFGVYSFWD